MFHHNFHFRNGTLSDDLNPASSSNNKGGDLPISRAIKNRIQALSTRILQKTNVICFCGFSVILESLSHILRTQIAREKQPYNHVHIVRPRYISIEESLIQSQRS